MIFSSYDLQTPLEINSDRVTTLVIENHTFYRDFISDLLLQAQNCSSRFCISDDDTVFNVSKDVEIVTDVFRLCFDSKTMQNKVNQAVADEYNLSQRYSPNLLNQINEAGASIVSALSFDADYTPLSDLNGVLKLFCFRIDADSLTLPEKIIEYVGFLNLYCAKKLFVILNLKSVLTQKEFSEFVKLTRYKKINILLIENQKSQIRLENEMIRIIDEDLCEI